MYTRSARHQRTTYRAQDPPQTRPRRTAARATALVIVLALALALAGGCATAPTEYFSTYEDLKRAVYNSKDSDYIFPELTALGFKGTDFIRSWKGFKSTTHSYSLNLHMLNNDYEYPYPSSNFFCTKVKYYDRRSDPDNRVFVPLEVTRSYKDIDLQFKIGRGSYTTPRDKQEMDKLTVGAYKNGFSCRFWLGGTMYQAGLLIYILPDDLPNTDLESEESNAENALFSIVKNVIDQYEENSNEKTT